MIRLDKLEQRKDSLFDYSSVYKCGQADETSMKMNYSTEKSDE